MSPDLPRRPRPPDRAAPLIEVVAQLGATLTAVATCYRDLTTSALAVDADHFATDRQVADWQTGLELLRRLMEVKIIRPDDSVLSVWLKPDEVDLLHRLAPQTTVEVSESTWTLPEARLHPRHTVEDLRSAIALAETLHGFGPITAVATTDPRIIDAAQSLKLDVMPVSAIPEGPWPAYVMKADMADTERTPWPPVLDTEPVTSMGPTGVTGARWEPAGDGTDPAVATVELTETMDASALLRTLIRECEARGFGPVESVVSTDMRVCGAALALGLFVGSDHPPANTLVVNVDRGPEPDHRVEERELPLHPDVPPPDSDSRARAEALGTEPPTGWPLVRQDPLADAEHLRDLQEAEREGWAAPPSRLHPADEQVAPFAADGEWNAPPTMNITAGSLPLPDIALPHPPPPAPPPPPAADYEDEPF